MEIQLLENLIDNEIEQYQELEKLYLEKKEILIKANSEALLQIDSKILDIVQKINHLAQKRIEMTQSEGIMTPSLSEIIGYLKTKDAQAAKRFEDKKEIVNELAKKIKELEKRNIELTQHGIQFTNKTLEAILKGASISTQEYDEKGKHMSNEDLKLSSIIEEV